MHLPTWVPVASLPVVTGVGLLWFEAPAGNWFALTRPALWRVAADALLVNVAIVVLAAPIVGAVVGAGLARTEASRGSVWAVARRLGWLVSMFVGASAAVTAAGFGVTFPALALVAASHATLGAAALALASMGVLCRQQLRDPLDAVACGTLLAGLVSFGVLLAGPLIQDLPYGITNVALVASPVVATAASAQIDILRSETFYQISSIAHRRFDYPAWEVATGVYLIATVLCFVLIHHRPRRLSSSPRQG